MNKKGKVITNGPLGSVVVEELPNTVRIVGSTLNGLRPFHFGNNELESLKDDLRKLEADVGAF